MADRGSPQHERTDPDHPTPASNVGPLLWAVLVTPDAAFRTIAARQPLGPAIAVVAVVTVLLAVAQALGFTTAPDAAPQIPRAALLAGALTITLPLGLVSFAVWAGLVLLSARLLGGDGTFRATACGLGFAYMPLALGALVTALGAAVVDGGGALAAVLLGTTLWSFVLDVFAVRAAHHLGTGRAVTAVVLPIVLLAVVGMLVVAALLAALLTTA
jgi:hypothetical protein